MVVLGLIGFTLAYMFTLVALFWFGLIALAAGLGQLLEAYHDEGWQARGFHALIGLLYLAAAAALIFLPLSSAYWLTLVLAFAMIGSGLVRIVSLNTVSGGSGTKLLIVVGSIISIGFGIYVLQVVTPPNPETLTTAASQREWLRSSTWVLGIFIAIELIAQGLTLVASAVTSKAPKADLSAAA